MRRLFLTTVAALALVLGSVVPALAAGHNPVCTIAAANVAGTAGAPGVANGCSHAP